MKKKTDEFGEILDLTDATEMLNISRQLLVKEIKENGLPARQVGREWRFSKRALIEWIEKKEEK